MSTYTPVLSLVLQIGAVEAADTHYEFIEPEHLFIGLCKLEGFANTNRLRTLGVPETQIGLLAAEIDLLMGLFGRFGINATTLRHELRQRKGTGSFKPPASNQDWMMHRSPQSREAFELADKIAKQSDSSMLAIFHLLAALLQDAHSNLALWLQTKRVDVLGLRQAAEITVTPDLTSKASDAPVPVSRADSLLAQYSRNLTQLVRQQNIQFNPDHQAIVLEILKILNRPAKENPLLLVGETRAGEKIAQSVAWQIVNGDVPSALGKARLTQMDVASMAENISYQGEFAERVRDFIHEAVDEDDRVLFISDIGDIIGSSSVRVDMSAAIYALKEALMQGKLRCIGAVSPSEFEHYIARSADWRSIFSPVRVDAALSSNAAEDVAASVEAIKPARISEPLQWPGEVAESETPSLQPTKPLREAEPSPTQPVKTPLDLLLDGLQTRLTRFGVQAQFKPAAIAFLRRLERSSSALEQEFAERIENPLGGMLLRGEVDYGQNVAVDVSADELVFQVERGRYA